MSFFEKLDDLIDKLDKAEAAEAAEVEAAEDDKAAEAAINSLYQAPIVEEATQNENSEDAKADDTIEKLSNVILKQNAQIESLQKQMANLINTGGVQINDGANIEPQYLPANEPDEYVALKDMDFNIKY